MYKQITQGESYVKFNFKKIDEN